MNDIKNQTDRSVIYALQTLVGELQDENEKLKKENQTYLKLKGENLILRNHIVNMAEEVGFMRSKIMGGLMTP